MNAVKQYHHTIPELIGKIDYNKYIYAVCRCPVDTRYSLVVDKSNLTEYERETGLCYIHCNICGSDITIGIGKEGVTEE